MGIVCCSRWGPGGAGLAMPGVMIAQSFKGITCFGLALHMKYALASLVDEGFFCMVSVFVHAGHFRLHI